MPSASILQKKPMVCLSLGPCLRNCDCPESYPIGGQVFARLPTPGNYAPSFEPADMKAAYTTQHLHTRVGPFHKPHCTIRKCISFYLAQICRPRGALG